jgi:hypothetical protein
MSRRSWRKPYLAVDADTGYIVASTLRSRMQMARSELGH